MLVPLFVSLLVTCTFTVSPYGIFLVPHKLYFGAPYPIGYNGGPRNSSIDSQNNATCSVRCKCLVCDFKPVLVWSAGRPLIFSETKFMLRTNLLCLASIGHFLIPIGVDAIVTPNASIRSSISGTCSSCGQSRFHLCSRSRSRDSSYSSQEANECIKTRHDATINE